MVHVTIDNEGVATMLQWAICPLTPPHGYINMPVGSNMWSLQTTEKNFELCEIHACLCMSMRCKLVIHVKRECTPDILLEYFELSL